MLHGTAMVPGDRGLLNFLSIDFYCNITICNNEWSPLISLKGLFILLVRVGASELEL